MSPEDLYLMHAVRVALQAAAEMDAKPKLIVVAVKDETPAPQIEDIGCASRTLH